MPHSTPINSLSIISEVCSTQTLLLGKGMYLTIHSSTLEWRWSGCQIFNSTPGVDLSLLEIRVKIETNILLFIFFAVSYKFVLHETID